MRNPNLGAGCSGGGIKKQIFSLLFLYKGGRCCPMRLGTALPCPRNWVCTYTTKLFSLHLEDKKDNDRNDQNNNENAGIKPGAENIPDHFATGKREQH